MKRRNATNAVGRCEIHIEFTVGTSLCAVHKIATFFCRTIMICHYMCLCCACLALSHRHEFCLMVREQYKIIVIRTSLCPMYFNLQFNSLSYKDYTHYSVWSDTQCGANQNSLVDFI